MSRPCANCEAPLPEPLPKFCPACGQETRLRAPTLGEFVQQLGGAFVSTEGAPWRTLKLPLGRRGELTRQYPAGRRKHHALPLRLYLTTSVLVLLVMRVLTQIGLGAGRAGIKDGRFFCENLPGWPCRRIQRRIDVAPQAFACEAQAIGERFATNRGAAMFVPLPAIAALMKLAYLNRGLRYTEHLVFALHLHAFWFLAIALTLANAGWLDAFATLAVPAYGRAAMKRVHAGRWWPLVLLLALDGVAPWSLLF